MLAKEALDDRHTSDKRACKIGKRRRADDHQQRNAVPHNGVTLVRFVADSSIVSERDPAAFAYLLQPYGIRRVVCEMIGMSLDIQTARLQNLRKLPAEITS